MTDDKHLRIIDDATGDELAEIGMSMRPKAVVCFECRFQGASGFWNLPDGRRGTAPECLAFHRPCPDVNKKADCKFFERRADLAKNESKSIARGLAFGLWLGVVAVALSLTSVILVLHGRCA